MPSPLNDKNQYVGFAFPEEDGDPIPDHPRQDVVERVKGKVPSGLKSKASGGVLPSKGGLGITRGGKTPQNRPPGPMRGR